MADDMDKEFRALMDSKGEDTPTEQELAASDVEQKQQREESAPDNSANKADAFAKKVDEFVKDGAAEQGKQDEAKAQPDASEEAKKHIDNMKAQARQEREKRRAEQAAREAAEARAAQLEANLRQIMAQMQGAQNKAPDPEVDVVAALKHTQAQLAAERQRQAQEAQQRQVIEQQTHIARTIQTKVEDFEAEFKAENPDYDDALEHVLDTKEAEFEMAGFSKSQAQAAAAQWAMNAAAAMLKTGRNPAEQAYAMAKRLGYQPKGAVTTPDPNAQVAQQNAQKLAAIKDGQNATSKMAGGGSNGGFDGSLKSIANLEGAAFDNAAEKFLRTMTRG